MLGNMLGNMHVDMLGCWVTSYWLGRGCETFKT